jgi:hypothetical protein
VRRWYKIGHSVFRASTSQFLRYVYNTIEMHDKLCHTSVAMERPRDVVFRWSSLEHEGYRAF